MARRDGRRRVAAASRKRIGGGNAPLMPTVEDVAAQAGVSTATVSRCLNSPEVVSETTRQRVMRAVSALGYAPNFGAQALAAQRTNTFGAIVATLANAIFARGLQAFQEELGRNGVTLLVASSSYDPEVEAEQIRTLIARGADALLLIGHDRAPDLYALLVRRQVPYVVAWVADPTETRLSIGFDNRAAMRLMTDQVIGLGHARLGFISGIQSGNDRARERASGVRESVEAHGLEPDAVAMIETRYSIANGADAFAALMSSPPRPTAVMCGNDVLAAGAIRQAHSLGLRVPEDVSITGFDDIEIAEITTPALTTVRVPHKEMGRGAAAMLLDLTLGRAHPRSKELPTTIIRRGSLDRVPK